MANGVFPQGQDPNSPYEYFFKKTDFKEEKKTEDSSQPDGQAFTTWPDLAQIPSASIPPADPRINPYPFSAVAGFPAPDGRTAAIAAQRFSLCLPGCTQCASSTWWVDIGPPVPPVRYPMFALTGYPTVASTGPAVDLDAAAAPLPTLPSTSASWEDVLKDPDDPPDPVEGSPVQEEAPPEDSYKTETGATKRKAQ